MECVEPEVIRMQSGLKLAHKGLLLIAVPLAFELLFVAVLYTLLTQAEIEAHKAEHSKQVIAEANGVSKLFYEAGVALATYHAAKNPLFQDRFEDITAKIPGQFAILDTLIPQEGEERVALMEARTISDKALHVLGETKASMDRGESIRSNYLIEQMRTQGDELVTSIHKLLDFEKRIEMSSPQHEAQLRRLIEWCLLGGVALNVVLAIFLALYFNRDVTNRLKTMMANTTRLASEQTLLPPVTGKDEISSLDQFFHSMASALNESRQRERELFAMVSHDLRSPLTSMQISLTLLAEGASGELPPKARKDVSLARNSASRLIVLINDLLDLEKMREGKLDFNPVACQIDELIEEALESVQGLCEERSITVQNCVEIASVKADPERVMQLVVNLLSNAIKYSPDGGTVLVQGAPLEGRFEVSICDQGPGIPDEQKPLVFERFKQLEGHGKGGSGLGLAISKTIVEKHGGAIGVKDNPDGAGTVFWFTLPLEGTTYFPQTIS